MTEIALFLFGIIFSVAGIVTANITSNWSTVAIVLLALGTSLFLAGIWLWGHHRKLWRKRSFLRGVGAVTTTATILAIVGLLNILAIANNTRWDITENRLFTLSEQSKAIVARLEKPLEVLVFDRNVNTDVENLLQNYRRQSKQFKFRFVDPEQEIGLAQQFNIQSLGETYLKYGNKQQKVNLDQTALGTNLTETQLTNAIEKIKRDRSVNIYLLQGHGEASLELVEGGLAQAIKVLEDKGNTVKAITLANKDLPLDANLVIIAGATRKLLPGEVTRLQKYLQNGGNLMLLLSPNNDIGINSLLSTWGIELDNRLIVDGSGSGIAMGFGPAVTLVNSYGKHPITASFQNGISIFPESRPIKIKPQASIQSTALAITDEQTWAESDLSSEEITFDQNKDLSGALNVAIALSQKSEPKSRMVVFGSSTFITNGWFQQQLNGDLWLNSVNWLVGEDQETLAIRPKEAANRRINLSSAEQTLISWLAIRIMPLIALIMGVILWQSRK